MNKRIYFQNRYLQFSDPELQPQQNQTINWEQGLQTQNDILKLLNAFMAEENVKSFILPANAFDLFMTGAKKELHYIEAAGGFIEKDAQYLCIHRLGRWDLPKGKLEKNETIEAAAVRECAEECGIGDLRIQYPLHSTFHLYPYKKGTAI